MRFSETDLEQNCRGCWGNPLLLGTGKRLPCLVNAPSAILTQHTHTHTHTDHTLESFIQRTQGVFCGGIACSPQSASCPPAQKAAGGRRAWLLTACFLRGRVMPQVPENDLETIRRRPARSPSSKPLARGALEEQSSGFPKMALHSP